MPMENSIMLIEDLFFGTVAYISSDAQRVDGLYLINYIPNLIESEQ
jgi:hypothetical protein